MGFFKRPAAAGSPVRASTAEPDHSRRYVELAFPMSRFATLATSCQYKLARAPIAAAARHEDVVTRDELAAVTELVRKVMVLDRDLSAWVAVKAMDLVNLELNGRSEAKDITGCAMMALPAVGLSASGRQQTFPLTFRPADGGVIPSDEDRAAAVRTAAADEDRAAALRIGTTAIGVLRCGEGQGTTAERRLFEDLFTGASGADVESLGYEITAWASIVVARIKNLGKMTSGFPDAPFRNVVDVPAMWAAGWYPNPTASGVVNGDAKFKRFWDGQWTDRTKIFTHGLLD